MGSNRFQVQIWNNHGSVTRMAKDNHSSQLFLKMGKQSKRRRMVGQLYDGGGGA